MKTLIITATIVLFVGTLPLAAADPGPDPPPDPGPVCMDGPLPDELEPCFDPNVIRDPQEIIEDELPPCTCDPIP